jgi:hypothetical protein
VVTSRGTEAEPSPTREATGQPAVHVRILLVLLAVSIVGGPLGFLVGGALAPSVHDPAAIALARNAAAVPARNAAHVAAFVVASYLLPVSAVGLARLAVPVTPRLATWAGVIAVVGWLPFSALAALDDLQLRMAAARTPASAPLLDAFSTDPVMNGYLLVSVLGHLAGYVLLGIALLRARSVPRWSAACLIASTPLTLGVFLVPGRPVVVGVVALALVVIGSAPAAGITLRQALGRRPSGPLRVPARGRRAGPRGPRGRPTAARAPRGS